MKVYKKNNKSDTIQQLYNIETEDIGNLLLKARISQNITQKKMSRGICSEGTVSNIEYGRTIPEKIMYEALAERLGYSTDNLGLVISEKEYEVYVIRDLINGAIYLKDWSLVKKYLFEYDKLYLQKNVLHKQYSSMVKAVIEVEDKSNYIKAIEILREVISVVYPEFSIDEMDKYLLSGIELRALTGIVELEWRLEREGIIKKAKKIVEYVEKNIFDEGLLVKVKPQCNIILAKKYAEIDNWDKVYKYTEESIKLLAKGGSSSLLYELLSISAKANNKIDNQHMAKRRFMECESLKFAEKVFDRNQEENFSDFLFSLRKEDLLLNSEMIYSERKAHVISLNNMETRGVNATSVCKIERGKRKPRRSTYSEILSKMYVYRGQFDGYVYTDQVEAHSLVKKINRQLSMLSEEGIDCWLEKLKQILDMTVSMNKQYVSCVTLNMFVRNGGLSMDRIKEQAIKLLAMTRPSFEKRSFYSLTKTETFVIVTLATVYRKSGECDKAIFLYEKILHVYRDSKINDKNQVARIIPIYANLAILYEEVGDFEASKKIAYEGGRVLLENKFISFLGRFMGSMAFAMLKEENCDKQECKEYLIYSYYIERLMGSPSCAKGIEACYLDNYNDSGLFD